MIFKIIKINAMKNKLLLYTIAVATLGLASCDDRFDMGEVRYSDRIGFSVEVNGDLQFASRASNSISSDDVASTTFDQEFRGKTLYLHAVEAENFPTGLKAKRDSVKSRGTIRHTGDVKSMGVSAVVWDPINVGDGWSSSNKIVYFSNLNLSVSDNNEAYTNYYWPAGHDKVRFYAYSPYFDPAVAGDGFENYSDNSGVPSFDFTVDNTIQDQLDLLVGSSEYEGDANVAAAEMPFCHALTGIQFKVSKDMAQSTIKSVTLSGIKNSGKYVYNYVSGSDANPDTDDVVSSEMGYWEPYSATVNYSVPFSAVNANGDKITEIVMPENATQDVVVNSDEDILILMPQEFTESQEAKITVELEDHITGQSVPLTADLTGKVWEKGKLLVYVISTNRVFVDYVLDLDLGNSSVNPGAVAKDYNSDGGNDTQFQDTKNQINSPFFGKLGAYKVDSYKLIHSYGGSKTYEPVKWEVKSWQVVNADGSLGEVNNGTPDIFDNFTSNGNGSSIINSATGERTAEIYNYGLVPYLTGNALNQSGQTIAFQGGALSATPVASHSDLKNKASLGTKDTPYDLSNPGGALGNPKETANSYIVSAPGYYALPLVYGNAIKNSTTNESAYCSNFTYKNEQRTVNFYRPVNVCYPFRLFDHGGNRILHPWIKDQLNENDENKKKNNVHDLIFEEDKPYMEDKFEGAKAEIIWQDEPCLLTDVKMIEPVTGKHYLQFRVRPDCIVEGNAVVGLVKYDSSGNRYALWSWHIWVTNNVIETKELINNNNQKPTQISNNVTAHGGKTFKVLNSYIGYCNAESKTYTERKIRINFAQIEDGKEVGSSYIIVDQKGGVTTSLDNVPYYQWGRKDPMLPTGEYSKDKLYYDNNRVQHSTCAKVTPNGAVGVSISYAIRNPEKYILVTGNQTLTNTHHELLGHVTLRNWCRMNGEFTFCSLWNYELNNYPSFVYTSSFYANDFFDNMHLTTESDDYDPDDYDPDDYGTGNVIKTIYDPCPPGYEMPRMDAFTGFTYDGTNSTPTFTYPVNANDAIYGITLDSNNNLTSEINDNEVTTRNTNVYTLGTTFKDTYYRNNYSTGAPYGLFFYCEPMRYRMIYRPDFEHDGKKNNYHYVDKRNVDGKTFSVVGYYSKSRYSITSDLVHGLTRNDNDGIDTYPLHAGTKIYIQAMGHRNNAGNVAGYSNYGNALTSGLLCIQWLVYGSDNTKHQFEPTRLCFIRETKNARGRGTMRTFSTSTFDLAFPVIPAMTGKNPQK